MIEYPAGFLRLRALSQKRLDFPNTYPASRVKALFSHAAVHSMD